MQTDRCISREFCDRFRITPAPCWPAEQSYSCKLQDGCIRFRSTPELRPPADAAKRTEWHEGAVRRLAALTPRQREVINLVLIGRPNKLIAHDLGVSQRTIENHRRAVMARTGARTLPELVRLVIAAETSAAATGISAGQPADRA